ncbi:MAG: sulfite exporter TauE/SafE family protein [Bacteroidota bacterium]|nr:sulfite exporter TauE/SafE family protein [Bacteroidota bacterium]
MFAAAALLLGLLGSVHCIGMCGPIALALPLRREKSRSLFGGIFIYNFGRAFTYALLGALSGLAGNAVKWAVGQQTLSIAAGILILLTLFAGMFGKRMKISSPLTKWFSFIRNAFGKLFRSHRPDALLLIGMLNGLLPCGLVYAALAGAAATGNPLNGAIFMFVFGTGTMPVMFFLSYAGTKIGAPLREKMRKGVPVFVGIMAVLLIVRGLGLGIPYVSPSFSDGKVTCSHCQSR